MDRREFFYAVADMRRAQRHYFQTRDRRVFLAARALEDKIDREITRVQALLDAQDTDAEKGGADE